MKLPADLQKIVDEAGARVRFRYPWWLRPFLMRGVLAITLGRRVYVDPAVTDLARCLRHELVHVGQVRRMGVVRFYTRYALEYFRNRRRGMGPHQAYRHISLEQEAFAAENAESV